jgi:hypothetical protein
LRLPIGLWEELASLPETSSTAQTVLNAYSSTQIETAWSATAVPVAKLLSADVAGTRPRSDVLAERITTVCVNHELRARGATSNTSPRELPITRGAPIAKIIWSEERSAEMDQLSPPERTTGYSPPPRRPKCSRFPSRRSRDGASPAMGRGSSSSE